MLNYNVLYHFYADHTQIDFKLYSKDQCASKLSTVLNAKQSWLFKIKFKLNKDKANIMVVGTPLQVRHFYPPSNLKLDQSVINSPLKLRNLWDVFFNTEG